MTRLRLLQHQHPARILEAQRRRQARFVRKFAQGSNNLYTSSDRRGLVLNILVDRVNIIHNHSHLLTPTLTSR